MMKRDQLSATTVLHRPLILEIRCSEQTLQVAVESHSRILGSGQGSIQACSGGSLLETGHWKASCVSSSQGKENEDLLSWCSAVVCTPMWGLNLFEKGMIELQPEKLARKGTSSQLVACLRGKKNQNTSLFRASCFRFGINRGQFLSMVIVSSRTWVARVKVPATMIHISLG